MTKTISKMLLLLLAGTGLAFGACSKNDSGKDDDGDDPKGPQGYMTIRFDGGFITRNSAMEEDPGIPQEAGVTDIRVVLYGVDTRKAEYSWDLSATNGDGSQNFAGGDVAKTTDEDPAPADPTSNRFFMVPKKVVKKDYLMVVLANLDHEVNMATQKGKMLTDFEKVMTYPVNLGDLIGSNTTANQEMERCFMSNARGYIQVAAADIKPTPKDALEVGVPKEAPLDRVVAKVWVKPDAPLFVNGSGDFSTFTWRLDGTNKKTYWMRNVTTTSEGGMEVWGDPRAILYAKDPNFDGFSNHRMIEDGMPGPYPALANEFNRIDKNAVTNAVSATSWEYALENTMAAEEQWEDVTTRVILKGNYIPDGFSANESYYFFQGKAYKHTDIELMMYNNFWEGHENLQAAVIADANAGPAKKFNFVASNSGSIAGSEPVESVTSGEGITFYKGGISYYYVLLRHFNDSQKPNAMEYGRYGVVRNNVYQVAIRNIAGPGKPDIPEPEGPDDKEEGYISADISIQPWYIREQNVEDL